MSKLIALVEDEDAIRQNLTEYLEENGYEVNSYCDMESAIKGIDSQLPDLALLDICLQNNKEGGFEVCTFIRNKSVTVPVVFLTSHTSEIDKISGLRLGADDYISKDNSLDVIVAHINARFRRNLALVDNNSTQRQSNIHTVDDLTIDKYKHESIWKGEKVKLTVTQFRILLSLVSSPGRIKSLDVLMSEAETVVEQNTIAVHIASIRSAFKAIDDGFDKIINVRGIGYKWN